jgi:chromate reductase
MEIELSNLTVGMIVGSVRKGSINQALASAFEERKPEGVDIQHVNIIDLPMYHQDLEDSFPPVATAFKDTIKSLDAVFFFTPEHNRSIPTILKNAIDWASRPYGDNAWNNKVAAIAGATGGIIATYGAQAHLRDMLVHVGTYTMGQPQFYFSTAGKVDDTGKITDEATLSMIDAYWASFIEYAARFKK